MRSGTARPQNFVTPSFLGLKFAASQESRKDRGGIMGGVSGVEPMISRRFKELP
jgi:hypothetical protein